MASTTARGWRHELSMLSVAPDATHLVLRIKLPDRPGALGAVASRIGAVGCDITDVLVSRTVDGSAIDVFHVNLPATRVDVIALLVHELEEVDGTNLESWFPDECCELQR